MILRRYYIMEETILKKLLLIVNPVSGQKKAKNYVADMMVAFEMASYEVKTVLTEKNKNAYAVVKEMGADYDVIVCVGGDGTLKETVCGVMEGGKDQPIGYIPMGTTNDFANSLKIPTKDVHAAIENIVNGVPRPVDMGKYEGENFIYVAGFGNFTAISYACNQKLKNAIGNKAYYLQAVPDFFKMKPYYARVEADGEKFEGKYFYGALSNSYGIGGMPVLHNIGVRFDDGLHELVLVKWFKNPKELIALALAMLKKDVKNNPNVIIRHVKEATFEFDKPTAFTLDGEFGGDMMKATISNKNHAVRMMLDHELINE
ncbi:MAG: diacylglycerol kinase family lipid kinase [Ruminococcaceae bacterium]|jgi:YegS/Rv2252/BmrU family lipid kinase|nr:diacylglycerol kinase family lipid kinase [Oscillospiraceae bacterium]